MTGSRNRYRHKKEPKASEYRKPYARTSVHVSQRRMHLIVHILKCAMVTSGVPEYRHARSNHVYSYRQKIALLVMKEYFGVPFRRMGDLIGSNPVITETLDLEFIPHYSTMAKFSCSVDREDLKRVIRVFQALAVKGGIAAVDGTCLSDRGRSIHFEKRMNDFGQGPTVRILTKVSIVADTENKIVLAADVSSSHRHDITFMPEMIGQLHGCPIGVLVADKGYDSERVHLSVRKELGIRFLTPCKGRPTVPAKHVTGHFRRYMRQFLGPKCTNFTLAYQMRSIVETVNSMIKRVFGSMLRSRNPVNREIETFARIIAHNLRQSMSIDRAWLIVL